MTDTAALRDIEHYDDLFTIVTVFYEQLLVDPIIGFFFTDIVQLDLTKHLPKIAGFWAFMLLGDQRYRGNVFEVHRQLHLKAAMTPDHFHRWLFILHHTIDGLHAGSTAEAMKLKASMIAKKMAQALANGARTADILEGVQQYQPNTRR